MNRPPSEQPPIRKRVIYRGRVQGVGFRFTTVSIARRYPVAGFVKNLPDGTVEVVAEGETGRLHEFLEAVADAFAGNIRDAETELLEPTGEFAGFDVRR
jgi:acylphosphatase